MEPYYPCGWLSFINQKKKKKKKLKFVNEIISTVCEVLFFKTTDLYTVYLFYEYADN